MLTAGKPCFFKHCLRLSDRRRSSVLDGAHYIIQYQSLDCLRRKGVVCSLQERDEGDDEEEEVSVPADPDQTHCALSGEKFDSFWDDSRNEWRYQGTVALTAEQASR